MMDSNGPPLHDSLTERELEILALLATGLSDREIATELFLSFNTVRWYNRQVYSKLAVSNRTQAVNRARELGLLAVDTAAKLDTPSLPQQSPNHNLPASTTPFIGRTREIAEVKHLLRTLRLLTLTGVGGTGKTRLALCVALDAIDDFSDGVYFVDLAPLSDTVLVAKAIAAVLDVFENPGEPLPDTLKRVLAGREMLLLIDNFEHVIMAAPLISDLLTASPGLKVLVTSREALRLSGEQEYMVPPLTLPSANAISVQAITNSEAGSLFVRRAQMVQPRFALNADNAPAIGQICARLDGLPLAIELAAARCKLLTPQALLSRLNNRLTALGDGSRDAPARQRTLRDTLEWSYNLLDVAEKTLFARLAVFRGGRSLEAVEAICRHDLSIDVLDSLGSLVDKSLVQQKETAAGEPRFVMLETIHEYAWERLEASGESDAMRQWHAEYFVELAERAEPELRLARYDYWCQRFELDLDNIRAVLEWALSSGSVTLGVRLASALWLFWYGKGYHVEGIRWIQPLLEQLNETPAMLHSKFLIGAGHMTFLRDLDAGTRLFVRALDISRELGDKIQIAWALIFLGYTMQRDPQAAIPIVEEGLALFRDLDHQPGIAQALNIIGEIARVSGDDDRAMHAYEQCLVVCQQTGEARRICYMYFGLSHIAQHIGHHEQVIHFGRQGLRLALERKDTNEMAHGVAVLAGSFSLLGQAQHAARLLGASEAAAERIGAFHHPSDRPEIDRITAETRAQLDKATFRRAWAAGRKMSLEQAVAYALGKYSS